MHDFITGIQQIGIGVLDARKAMLRYKALFGMDVLIFDDIAEATLMTDYTGGNKYKRRAILTLNINGGGGFEIWQFQNNTPKPYNSIPQFGDIGIYAAKIKCVDINLAYNYLNRIEGLVVSEVIKDEDLRLKFWVRDEYHNTFQLIESNVWFCNKNKKTGGVVGAVIGVCDMDESLRFYKMILGNVEVVSDSLINTVEGFNELKGNYRSVILKKQLNNKGAFSKLMGDVEIELVQCLDRTPNKIFKGRFWGDCGFIHLCLDVLDMDKLKKYASQHKYNFTVDSNESFAMENAAGRFCYVEDPDGTLIELVETHKVPILKKYGLYLNLKKRDINKPLPDWIIKLLALSKVK